MGALGIGYMSAWLWVWAVDPRPQHRVAVASSGAEGLRISSALVRLGFAGPSSPIPLCPRRVYSTSLPGHVFVNVVCRSAADLCISSSLPLFILRGDSPAAEGPRSNVIA